MRQCAKSFCGGRARAACGFALSFLTSLRARLACILLLCGAATANSALIQMRSAPETLELSDGTLVFLSYPAGALAVSDVVLRDWIEENACAVRTYYGRFPVRRFRLTLLPRAGDDRIEYGNARQGSPPHITIYVGAKANKREFQRSWILAHEMLHLAFPSLDETHRWLEEGIATFVEPLARAMAGLVTEESVWREFVEEMARGASASSGLDGSTDADRVYWGGALFCLLADIEIRQTTRNQKSLQDALQAILQREGSINDDRRITKVLRSADNALGVQTLTALYKKMGKQGFALSDTLRILWSQLGVERRSDSTVHFNANAPLAALRQSMTLRAPPCRRIKERSTQK